MNEAEVTNNTQKESGNSPVAAVLCCPLKYALSLATGGGGGVVMVIAYMPREAGKGRLKVAASPCDQPSSGSSCLVMNLGICSLVCVLVAASSVPWCL